MLSYLKYPIQRSFLYGVQSDPVMERISRRSQAVFNIIAVLDPQIHDWDVEYRIAKLNRGTMERRAMFTPLFVGVFNNLGFHASMGGSAALGESAPITLGDAALKLPPLTLHALMLNDPQLATAPFFASRMVTMHLKMPDVLAGLVLAHDALHEVKEPA